MKNKIFNISYFPMLILYLEFVFRTILETRFLSFSAITIFVFSIFYGLTLFLLTSIVKEKFWKASVFFVTIILLILFMTQATFYLIYDSVYSFSIVGGVFDAAEFSTFLIDIVLANWYVYILFLMPLILLVVIHKKSITKTNLKINEVGYIVFIALIIFSVNLLVMPKEGVYSSYNLYYKINSPNMMITRLGLTTTVRLDITRTLFGFDSSTDLAPEIIDDDFELPDEEPDLGFNILEIDFDSLIANESDQEIIQLHNYFKSVEPTEKNEMTAMFEGKNLIMIVAESLDHIAIDENLTPTLYKLSQGGLNFTNFYTPVFISTIDGEYTSKTGLLPKEGVWSMWRARNNYQPFVLGNQFKNLGYNTTAFHNGRASYYNRDESYPSLGYQNYYACGKGLNIDCSLWPQSDLEMIEKSSDIYMGENNFFTYFLTISGHLRYNLYNQMAVKNWDYVKSLSYSTPVKAYLAQHIELDKALERLIDDLEKNGILDDTVIAILSDHWPYGLTTTQLNERSTSNRDDFFERDRLPFIIWNNQIEGSEINLLGSNVDITPTLLNLFGFDYDSRLMIGRDIFSNNEPIVVFSDRSWITNEGKYSKGRKTFYPNENVEINDEYIERINSRVHNSFQVSRLILDKDYYSKLK